MSGDLKCIRCNKSISLGAYCEVCESQDEETEDYRSKVWRMARSQGTDAFIRVLRERDAQSLTIATLSSACRRAASLIDSITDEDPSSLGKWHMDLCNMFDELHEALLKAEKAK